MGREIGLQRQEKKKSILITVGQFYLIKSDRMCHNCQI